MVDAVELAIADFAQHLVPEGFAIPSTAYRVDLLPLPPRSSAFAEWIERCRQDAVAARYAGGGAPSGVVYVRRRDERWRWDLEPCADLEWLTARVNDEISAFAEPWVFVSLLRSREQALAAAGDGVDPDEVPWTQPWYAEARSRSVARIYAGVAEVRGTAVTGRGPLPDKTPFERAARRLLARHHGRRQFRLR
ncbi:MAG TPA: hypothetical protein VM307_04340 [Egibacteraceae bacterium]|nr:hypothetical protein [Egibacteraceae bacterium]